MKASQQGSRHASGARMTSPSKTNAPRSCSAVIAFVTSAALAGAAGALFGLNYASVNAAQFDFNTSIMVLVYVVLGGLGNMWGSIIATVVIYVLPEALREYADLRMLLYAIILILVMLATHNPQLRALVGKIIPKRGKGAAANG